MEPLNLERVHHLSRCTNDVQRLTDFYVKVLGFKQFPRPALAFGGSWLKLGDLELHIIERDDKATLLEDPFNNDGKQKSHPYALHRGHHTALWTKDFGKIKKQLDKFGIEYGETTITTKSKRYQLWFYDCDGNGIEILSDIGKSKL